MADNPLSEVFDREEAGEPDDSALGVGGFGGVDPFVATAAMERADRDPIVARELSAYLRDLARLARVQFEHLHEQRLLNVGHLRVRLWRERFQLAFQMFLALGALAVVVFVATMLHDAFASRRVVIEAFDTPPALAVRGLTPKVVAGELLDSLSKLQAATRATDRKLDIANAWDQDVKIEIPQTGASVGEIDRLLRARFGHDMHIGGSVTQEADGRLSLRVRGTDAPAQTFTGAPGDIDKLATKAAEYLYGAAEPYLFAVYLSQSGRAAEAETFVAATYPTAAQAVRPELVNVWGNALAARARYGDAVEKYRLAIQLDQRLWSAWANLLGALIFTDGEEAAFNAGGSMRRAAAVAPRSNRPAADNWQNLDYLTQDWAAELADIDFDAGKLGGQGTDDVIAGPSLADAAARLHDWTAAGRYLLASDPKDPNTQLERLFLQGYRALDDGAPARAVAPLVAVDAMMRANPSLKDTYVDATCYLGLAYGLTDQAAKAEAVFDRRGRWVACYSFHADTLDHAGDWAGAQRAYARAVALAPDLPFAYDRWGLALLRRGDGAGAAARFAAANRRGPRWADPLKHWGDALAIQGRRGEAGVKYNAAARLAPHWAAARGPSS
ncbi:MAG: hypothetical protein ABI306_00190 [Caulobacteraceae bacterium]